MPSPLDRFALVARRADALAEATAEIDSAGESAFAVAADLNDRNALAPGFFATELSAPVFGDADTRDWAARQIAIVRNGELDDLAGPTIFFASPASGYITGQTLAIDGGFTAK